jgi:hypothetical protein
MQVPSGISLLPEDLVVSSDQSKFVSVTDRVQIDRFDVDVVRLWSGVVRIVPVKVLFTKARLAEVLQTNRPFITAQLASDEVLCEQVIVIDCDLGPESGREQGDSELASAFWSRIRTPIEPAR